MTIALSANTPRISYTVAQGLHELILIQFLLFFYQKHRFKCIVDGVARTFDASTANTTQYTVTGGDGLLDQLQQL